MFSIFTKNWWVFALRGLFALVFGVLALVWPEITLISLVTMFGVFVLLDGILDLVAGFASTSTNKRWWVMILEGLLDIGVAMLTFFWPNITAVVLLYLIAAWSVIMGIMEIIAAIQIRKEIEDEWRMILSGAISVLFGIVLFIYPGASAISMVWLIGVFAIFFGVLLILLAFRLRKLGRESQPMN
jgi:uncharacterized membrane protein HdeD (DUF308 family)